jgi:hypothetical protein
MDIVADPNAGHSSDAGGGANFFDADINTDALPNDIEEAHAIHSPSSVTAHEETCFDAIDKAGDEQVVACANNCGFSGAAMDVELHELASACRAHGVDDGYLSVYANDDTSEGVAGSTDSDAVAASQAAAPQATVENFLGFEPAIPLSDGAGTMSQNGGGDEGTTAPSVTVGEPSAGITL